VAVAVVVLAVLAQTAPRQFPVMVVQEQPTASRDHRSRVQVAEARRPHLAREPEQVAQAAVAQVERLAPLELLTQAVAAVQERRVYPATAAAA